MTEQDDLFEFGGFEDDESLELDLNDLFGDLEVLSLDPDNASATATAAPAAAAPTASVPAAAPAAAPVGAAAAQAAAPVQPIPGQIPVAAQPAMMPYVMAPPQPAPSSSKATVAIAIAAIVTLANVAVIAAPMFNRGTQQVAPAPVHIASAPTDQVLVERINDLEARLHGIRSSDAAIRTNDLQGEGDNQRHRAFDAIENNITLGQYVEARQRLYSLLAIIDRFPTYQRNTTEELASYMLADTYRLEAMRTSTEDSL